MHEGKFARYTKWELIICCWFVIVQVAKCRTLCTACMHSQIGERNIPLARRQCSKIERLLHSIYCAESWRWNGKWYILASLCIPACFRRMMMCFENFGPSLSFDSFHSILIFFFFSLHHHSMQTFCVRENCVRLVEWIEFVIHCTAFSTNFLTSLFLFFIIIRLFSASVCVCMLTIRAVYWAQCKVVPIYQRFQ